jgi:hypothetical protein
MAAEAPQTTVIKSGPTSALNDPPDDDAIGPVE